MSTAPTLAPHRKAHTKSRKGCVNCKHRRVKCDEHRPSCHRCNRRGDVCSFSRNPDSSESPPSMKDKSDPSIQYLAGIDALYQQWHSMPSIDETWGQGLELMHHYTEHVGNSLSYRRDVQHVWRVIVPEIAFENPFLMHIILATSASHKAHLIPAQREGYLGLTVHHQTAGLEGFRVALCDIDSHDWKAIFCFSAMIGLSMHNTSSTTSCRIDDDGTHHVPLSLTGFVLIRGMSAVMKLLQPRLMESILSPLGNGVWVSNEEIIRADKGLSLKRTPLPEDIMEALDKLNDFYDASLSELRKGPYKLAVIEMRRSVHTMAQSGPYPEPHAVMASLHLTPDEVLRDLLALEPFAMVYLAHLAVLFGILEIRFWYLSNASKSMFEVVDKQLINLPRHLAIILWARRQVYTPTEI